MISADFKGKCVLVTGAVSGIGLATSAHDGGERTVGGR